MKDDDLNALKELADRMLYDAFTKETETVIQFDKGSSRVFSLVKIEKGKASIRKKMEEKLASKKEIPIQYDEVYYKGTEWLNSLEDSDVEDPEGSGD